ncbi:MAG: hypothetical protein J1F09_01965 [Oscillospiraceae bacterium]|nr:hypothetical protein [Oscillospiraceae bacterium]
MGKHKVGAIVFGILFVGFIAGLIININSLKFPAAIPAGILTLLCGFGMIINIIMFVKTRDPELEAKVKNNAMQKSVSGKLVDGLPIPAQVQVVTKLFNEKIELEAFTGNKPSDHQRFNLDIEKVQKVTILDEKQMQQIVTQSAPGMIIGAAAFGLLGAMVGGRVKTKDKVKINRLLLIDYISNEENKQILINVSDSGLQADAFANKFHNIKPQSNQPIQL